MPNCDFGGPCTCSNCRTKILSIKCPSCSFETNVSYEMSYTGSTDRKGIFDYTFIENTTRGKELDCYKCGFHMTDVPYYVKIEKQMNDRKLSERTCESCNRKEFEGFFPLEFRELGGKELCLECVEEKVKGEIPDPSTEDRKFVFNKKTLKYELSKVRQPCVDCGKKQWVKADEQWRKQCKPCYKKSRNY